jgi:hypothetical protein
MGHPRPGLRASRVLCTVRQRRHRRGDPGRGVTSPVGARTPCAPTSGRRTLLRSAWEVPEARRPQGLQCGDAAHRHITRMCGHDGLCCPLSIAAFVRLRRR